MKPIHLVASWACTVLLFGAGMAVAQVAARAAAAPTAPGVTSHVETPAASDPDQPAVAEQQDPTAGHDEATGKNLPTPDLSHPASTQVEKATAKHPDFLSLDTNNHGYLTVDDVSHNQWLSANFSRCDTNHDGHLSQQEYANCK